MLGCLCVIVGLRGFKIVGGRFKVLETVLLWVFSVGCGYSFVVLLYGRCGFWVSFGLFGLGFVGSGSC